MEGEEEPFAEPQSEPALPEDDPTSEASVPWQDASPRFVPLPYQAEGGCSLARPAGAQVTYRPIPTVKVRTAGYLNGVANVIRAHAQYYQDYQAARLAAQKVEQEKIRTRAMLRGWERCEQSLIPSAEDMRAKRAALNLRRARRDPPHTEIWSGDSLNELLKADSNLHKASAARGPLVPLAPEVLRHINLSGGTSRGAATVLRKGKPRWPLILQEELFTPERKEIDRLLPRAVVEAREGEVRLATFKALRAAIARINDKIKAAKNMSLEEICQAQRYADQLSDAVSLFQDANVANYFNGRWEAKGKNVAELIDYMTRKGLTFAPAGEGDRTAYLSLYQALSTYDRGITRLAWR